MAQKKSDGIRLVVADLAGTTVDYGSCAPAGAFVELFRRRGVTITQEIARGPMGTQKRDHIATLTREPSVAEAWRQAHGALPDEAAIDDMYREFIPLQVKCLPDFGDVIPGVIETVMVLRARGIRFAVTTGYNREMMEIVLDCAAAQSFVPEASFCAEDVAAGRPAPWMIYGCMESLGVYPPSAVFNIGDTLPDVQSGRNAGVWSIGVTRTGNMLGLDLAAAEALPDAERRARLVSAEKSMREAGAHFILESFADCPACIADIESRMARGERP